MTCSPVFTSMAAVAKGISKSSKRIWPICSLKKDCKFCEEGSFWRNKNLNKPIKSVLLDQSILAGIGNIYADEICFACKINPEMKAKNISKEISIEILRQASIILKAAIKDGGSTIKTFQSAHGVDGLFQIKLKVYGRENQKCVNCNNLIIKTFVNKRGTHYCPNCQKG